MLKILITMITLATLSLADGPVLQTGQTSSYDAGGNVVTDGSVKDDGYYKTGVSRSYARDDVNDIVTDNATGLQWQDNTNSGSSWDNATAHCEDLVLDGDDWHFPSIEELQTLVDYSRRNPAVTPGVFNVISSGTYWSSTPSAHSTSGAWIADFEEGYLSDAQTTRSYSIRCVRGELLEPSSLSRNEDIVSDATTGLQWQDDAAARDTEVTWAEAIDYCENTITLGGYSDWRLPNLNELLSIVDYTRDSSGIDYTVFQNTGRSTGYWSSTSNVNPRRYVWNVSFLEGYSRNGPSTDSHFVRCVRSGQRLKQGTNIYIPGSPTGSPGIYLPNCGSGRLMQGASTCDESAEPVDPPGFTLPTCPEGKRLVQGTSQCSGSGGNTAPTATDATTDAAYGETVTYDLASHIADNETADSGLTITVLSEPTKGSLSWNETEFTFTATPASGVFGEDSFTYEVEDPEGLTSAVKTVTIINIAEDGF